MTSEPHQAMKLWQKSLVLMLALFIYLLLGAVVFRFLELGANEEAQLVFLGEVEDFLENHTCVSADDLRELFQAVETALLSGAFKLDSDPTNDRDLVVWDMPGAVFFTTTVVTTIGYGNLAPKTSIGRVVCMFYALVGIPLTYWLLSAVGDTFQGCWRPCHGLIRRCTKHVKAGNARTVVEVVIICICLYVLIVALPGIAFAYLEHWNFFQSHYFCFISLSTIGFGDFVPAENPALTPLSRWVYKLGTSAYLIIGLSILSVAIKGFMASQQTKINKWKAKTAAKRLVQLHQQQHQPHQQQEEHQLATEHAQECNGKHATIKLNNPCTSG
ncbi:potassium channel subfamily K member 16-like [Acanthaster planci]|uniref:Potassium channel subfamily K member 16-like n=1 Tax=Acanthaster planci TaxID=133434 RepID=A0A8B7ZDS1_ACAPL|nr:potassium channel subfamily K member 16-like [Acanthaster planci]